MEDCKILFCAAVLFHCFVSYLLYNQPLGQFEQIQNKSLNWLKESQFKKEYELSRREAQRYLWEQWKDMKSMHKTSKVWQEEFLEVLAKQQLLRERDGFDYNREQLNSFVSNLIQEKIFQNQNPADTGKMIFWDALILF